MGEIVDLYNKLEEYRAWSLQQARDVERLTVPVGVNDVSGLDRPYVGSGRRGVGNLSALIVDSAFPAGRRFFRLSAGSLDDAMPQRGRDILRGIDNQVQTFLEGVGTQAKYSKTTKNILVAGCCLCNLAPRPAQIDQFRTRVFPLARFVLRRDDDDLAQVVLVQDKRVKGKPILGPGADNSAAVGASAGSIDGGLDPSVPKLYTLIDWEDNVVRQEDTQTNTVRVIRDSKPSHWYVPSGSDLLVNGYPIPYLWAIEPELWSIDAFRFGLHRLAELAEKIYGFADPDSGVDPRQLSRAKPGQWFSGDGEKIGWLSSAIKLSDHAVARQEVVDLEATVRDYTLDGLEERVQQTNTAYAASLISRLVNGRLHGFGGEIERTWQRPLVLAALDHLGVRTDIAPGVRLNVVILTGEAAYAEDQEFAEIDQAVATAVQLKPETINYVDVYGKLKRQLARNRSAEGLILDKATVDQQLAQQAQQLGLGASPVVSAELSRLPGMQQQQAQQRSAAPADQQQQQQQQQLQTQGA